MSTSYGLNAGMELEVHKSALRAVPVRERPEAGIGLVAAPIEIDVKTVQELGEPGCKRLAVTTSQDGVVDFNREKRDTKPARNSFT